MKNILSLILTSFLLIVSTTNVTKVYSDDNISSSIENSLEDIDNNFFKNEEIGRFQFGLFYACHFYYFFEEYIYYIYDLLRNAEYEKVTSDESYFGKYKVIWVYDEKNNDIETRETYYVSQLDIIYKFKEDYFDGETYTYYKTHIDGFYSMLYEIGYY